MALIEEDQGHKLRHWPAPSRDIFVAKGIIPSEISTDRYIVIMPVNPYLNINKITKNSAAGEIFR